jgi:hypothetical protein
LPPKPEGHENILDHISVAIDPHQSLHAMPPILQGFAIVLDHLGFETIAAHQPCDLGPRGGHQLSGRPCQR